MINLRTKELKPLWDALPVLNDFLSERGLSLSDEKTLITSASKGFDFLGFFIRCQGGIESVEPSVKSVKRVLDAVRGRIVRYADKGPQKLAEKLNPLILGWANYHRYVSARAAFLYVDAMVAHYLAVSGVNEETRRAIASVSDTPLQNYMGIPPELNPFEAYWDNFYEEWEYFWWY
jgi:hypothetical protein